MFTEIIFTVVFSVILLFLAAGASYDAKDRSLSDKNTVFGFLIFFIALVGFSYYMTGYKYSQGSVAVAKDKLSGGDVYTLITPTQEEKGKFYAIVKTDGGDIYGLCFTSPPAKRSVVAVNKKGETVFLPLSAENQDEKQDERSGE